MCVCGGGYVRARDVMHLSPGDSHEHAAGFLFSGFPDRRLRVRYFERHSDPKRGGWIWHKVCVCGVA